jgi:hypothetical protein
VAGRWAALGQDSAAPLMSRIERSKGSTLARRGPGHQGQWLAYVDDRGRRSQRGDQGMARSVPQTCPTTPGPAGLRGTIGVQDTQSPFLIRTNVALTHLPSWWCEFDSRHPLHSTKPRAEPIRDDRASWRRSRTPIACHRRATLTVNASNAETRPLPGPARERRPPPRPRHDPYPEGGRPEWALQCRA